MRSLDLRAFLSYVYTLAREHVSLHVVTLLPRGRRTRRRACPSINVNQPLNNDAPCKEDFIVLRREQSWRPHNAAPSFFSGFSAAKLPSRNTRIRANLFLSPRFLLSLFCSCFVYELCCMYVRARRMRFSETFSSQR